jgi:hypothetical protein
LLRDWDLLMALPMQRQQQKGARGCVTGCNPDTDDEMIECNKNINTCRCMRDKNHQFESCVRWIGIDEDWDGILCYFYKCDESLMDSCVTQRLCFILVCFLPRFHPLFEPRVNRH